MTRAHGDAVDDWVAVTNHAYDRWGERSDLAGTIVPRVAWYDAEPVPDTHGHVSDETRFHRDSGTVPLRRGDALVTVLGVEQADRDLKRALHRIENVNNVPADQPQP